jgi:WD40 repeat protein
VLSPFEPPHMDTVTSLTVLNGYLISGSKDKNVRLWALDNGKNNIK